MIPGEKYAPCARVYIISSAWFNRLALVTKQGRINESRRVASRVTKCAREKYERTESLTQLIIVRVAFANSLERHGGDGDP